MFVNWMRRLCIVSTECASAGKESWVLSFPPCACLSFLTILIFHVCLDLEDEHGDLDESMEITGSQIAVIEKQTPKVWIGYGLLWVWMLWNYVVLSQWLVLNLISDESTIDIMPSWKISRHRARTAIHQARQPRKVNGRPFPQEMRSLHLWVPLLATTPMMTMILKRTTHAATQVSLGTANTTTFHFIVSQNSIQIISLAQTLHFPSIPACLMATTVAWVSVRRSVPTSEWEVVCFFWNISKTGMLGQLADVKFTDVKNKHLAKGSLKSWHLQRWPAICFWCMVTWSSGAGSVVQWWKFPSYDRTTSTMQCNVSLQETSVASFRSVPTLASKARDSIWRMFTLNTIQILQTSMQRILSKCFQTHWRNGRALWSSSCSCNFDFQKLPSLRSLELWLLKAFMVHSSENEPLVQNVTMRQNCYYPAYEKLCYFLLFGNDNQAGKLMSNGWMRLWTTNF